MPEAAPLTDLLRAWRAGEAEAEAVMAERVHGELHRLARRAMAKERRDHTLQPTALVNEAFIRLVDAEVDWEDRGHFFRVAARAMRRILVDHARTKRRAKRGGGERALPLEGLQIPAPATGTDVLALDQALEALQALDPRKAQAVELLYFGGLSYAEIARTLDVSEATVHRDLRMARAWLYARMSEE